MAVRDDATWSSAFLLQLLTKWQIHTRTRRNLVQEENFSGSGKYALVLLTDVCPNHFVFFTSSFSKRGPTYLEASTLQIWTGRQGHWAISNCDPNLLLQGPRCNYRQDYSDQKRASPVSGQLRRESLRPGWPWMCENVGFCQLCTATQFLSHSKRWYLWWQQSTLAWPRSTTLRLRQLLGALNKVSLTALGVPHDSPP